MSYLNISKVADHFLVLSLVSIEETLANIFTLGSHRRSSVSMDGM